jgi:hypothetical protein
MKIELAATRHRPGFADHIRSAFSKQDIHAGGMFDGCHGR